MGMSKGLRALAALLRRKKENAPKLNVSVGRQGSDSSKAKRRKRNKIARKSRRINRRRAKR